MAPSADATVPATRRTRKSLSSHSDMRRAMDKDNATVDVGSTLAAGRKSSSRSKSLGPGGLDALRQGSGNRRASLVAPAKPPRSILKPTISSLPEIPPMKPKQPDLIDFYEPTTDIVAPKLTGGESNGSKVAVRTEEEQQAAARDREERDRRDARRKSLANRRVSFAAEATLHTFHEIEYMQDAANAGKRNTGRGQLQNAPEVADEDELQQTKQRRSSGLPALNFRSSDDDTNTSTIYSDDSEPADAVEEVNDVEDDGSSSDSDDGTMMTIDAEEVTGTTAASDRSLDETGDSSTLDEALRLAARTAGNQRLGDDSDEDDGEEFIPSFGWGNQGTKPNTTAQDRENEPYQPPAQPRQPQPQPPANDESEMDMDMDMDMDETRAVGGILRSAAAEVLEPEEEMSMDVTRVLGGILSQHQVPKQQAVIDDEEGEDDAPMEEATMEFTTAIGGIHRPAPEEEDESEDNEDMSMELTTVMGGVLSQQKRKSMAATRRRTINQTKNLGADETAMDMDMDMTVGVGRIISATLDDESDGDDDEVDATMGMEMTTAIGGILSNGTNGSRALAKQIMEQEADTPDSPVKVVMSTLNQGEPAKQSEAQPAPEPSPETISPGLSAFLGNGLRRSVGPNVSTPESPSKPVRTPSPAKSLTTPQSTARKAKTPASVKSSTPRIGPTSATRTTPRVLVNTSRSASPKRPSPTKSNSRTPSPVKPARRKSLFQEDTAAGNKTPTVVLTPQTRRLSGVGVDRAGLGSPQVAALFDRRGSIGDVASVFVPGQKGVSFQTPQEMADELERDRHNEEDKENQRRVLEREADGEPTLNLREMIDSMSPKRNALKGRKSLHVGSAKGILGKRPNELDDEEDEYNDGVKRLKGHQSSPVKNIKLKQPPSKAETTGRLTRSFRKSQPNFNNSTPTLSSPQRSSPATTPKNQRRFKDIQDDHTNHTVNFAESTVKDAAQLEDEVNGERIHLQDFLNMTSIRFMELTTTKRRQTTVPGTLQAGFSAEGEDDLSLERCVVAGACTVPTLELYQHSCRELKKYISEGRRMVKEIETDTFEENPTLFKEYMAATPEVKALMDNQFKNVKTHARLLSKAMWYEWRMKLQDGLRDGLIRIDEGMEADQESLEKQKALLDSVMPALQARYNALVEESTNLEEVAQELADCDPSELEAAREELSSLDHDIEHKKKLIAQLRGQFQTSEADIDTLTAQKQQCLEEIKQSEKIREECRGWTSTEVNSLKARADAIEKEHGWSVTGISGTTLSLAYNREIEIVFDITAFQTHKPNSKIDLWYIGDSRERDPLPKTTEKDFFLQCIRDHIRALPQSRTESHHLLSMVRLAWDQVNRVSAQINRLNVTFPTTVKKTSDINVAMTTSLLLVPLETRVEATLNLSGQSGPDGLDIAITPETKVVYGEHFNVGKVSEFLASRIGKLVGTGEEEWSDVMVELHGRLIARGRK
ncbi:hypothetical protein B0J13DRAFT_604509 [Dactylonectria estremocensis]|uniref:Spc7 kinetochore protein domain-containing protein n=1 Tax=Dactylonectria estremocensis TaxID=1079267 RepID=A0A9P9F7S4_9HYPO|nr:hypothetical protein B0J13DRAFT_604509 [Dactylonectria estremocensis]